MALLRKNDTVFCWLHFGTSASCPLTSSMHMFPKNRDHLAGECVEIACQATRQTVVGTTVLVGPGIARPDDVF